MINNEKRKSQRFAVDIPIEYTRRDFVVKQDRVTNLSAEGLMAFFSEPMEIGQYLRTKLFIPTESKLDVVGMVAQVVWAETEQGGDLGNYRSGVKFVDISDRSLRKITHFLRHLLE
jgi:hypothetical protein